MIDSIYIAASGMQAEQTNLDLISNNLANLNTIAYKKGRVNFADLVYGDAVSSSSEITRLMGEAQVGMGSAVGHIGKDFAEGDLKSTGNPLHIAIRGRGFLEVELENGQIAYTRNGNLQINKDGYLETIDGYRLASRVQLPPDASELFIRADGVVEVRVDGESEAIDIGRIELADVMNLDALEALGDNLYLANDETGLPVFATPGESGMGALAQGYLESSNVDLVQELMELVVTQRAYEVNSQVIRVSDEILKINNNLRS